MTDVNCPLCISQGIMFIHRIIVTSVGNKSGQGNLAADVQFLPNVCQVEWLSRDRMDFW